MFPIVLVRAATHELWAANFPYFFAILSCLSASHPATIPWKSNASPRRFLSGKHEMRRARTF
jgi:hypothetical protein